MMTYQTPRDEILLGILIVAGGAVLGFGRPLAIAGVALGVSAYIAVAVLGVGSEP